MHFKNEKFGKQPLNLLKVDIKHLNSKEKWSNMIYLTCWQSLEYVVSLAEESDIP